MNFLRSANQVVSAGANPVERFVNLAQLRDLRFSAVGDFFDGVGDFAGGCGDLLRCRRQIARRLRNFVGRLSRARCDPG